MAAQLLPAIPETVARKRFTRDELHRMKECGILEGRCELIEGDPIEKMGQNPPHANALRLMCAWPAACFGMERLSVQLPIEVAPDDQQRSEPEPDMAVLNALLPDYSQRHPVATNSPSPSKLQIAVPGLTSPRKPPSTPAPASPNTGSWTSLGECW
jgi:hypothetical protein